MKRFIGKLVLLILLLGFVVALMHVAAVWRLRGKVLEAYTLPPDTRYLFIGSSQVGCSIEERPARHNKVLWVHDTTALSFLMRLQELDRRGQLDHLAAVVVPFNFLIPTQQNRRQYLWGWYQELPVSYRHMDILPYDWLDFVAFMASNLRFPFLMHLCAAFPAGRPSVRSRPPAWKAKYLSDFERQEEALALGKGCVADWERILDASYAGMNDICTRHGLRFCIYRQPVLEQYYNHVPRTLLDYEKRFLERMQGAGAVILNAKPYYPDTLFFDSVHFVEAGRTRFTDDLFRLLSVVTQPARN